MEKTGEQPIQSRCQEQPQISQISVGPTCSHSPIFELGAKASKNFGGSGAETPWHLTSFNCLMLSDAYICCCRVWQWKLRKKHHDLTISCDPALQDSPVIDELQFQVSEILAGDPSKLTKSCTRKSMKQVSGVSRSDVLDTSGHNFFWGGGSYITSSSCASTCRNVCAAICLEHFSH